MVSGVKIKKCNQEITLFHQFNSKLACLTDKNKCNNLDNFEKKSNTRKNKEKLEIYNL